jgi:hypothetical protein
MPKYKDWKKGTFRIKLEVVTPKGNRLDYYIPWVPEVMGDVFLALASTACKVDKPLSYTTVIKEVRQWLKELKKEKKEA